MKVLSFDVSSTTIGWCIIEHDNQCINILDLGYISPNKKLTEIPKLADTKKSIEKLIAFIGNVDAVAIEETPLFMTGRGSSANSIRVLSVYTRMVAVCVYDNLGIEANFYPVITIRSILRKLAGLEDNVDKEKVPSVIEQIILKINNKPWEFPYKLNRKDKIISECYDMADAIAVGITHLYKQEVIANVAGRSKKSAGGVKRSERGRSKKSVSEISSTIPPGSKQRTRRGRKVQTNK